MMLLEAFLQTRTDRFIAAGRAVIALFALTAIWIDPSQPAGAADVTYALLVGYLAFAGGILLASRRETLWSAEIGLGSHIVDLAVFSTIMFLTEGATSPFFLLFTFSLLSATFRWQWKGALWTAVTVLFLLVAIAVVYRAVAPGQPFEVDRFAIRCAHIVVIGAMLVYFGFRQQRSAEEAARLAAWQPDPAVGADSRSLLAACLDHVANVFAAPRVVLVLQMQADPWASVATWEDGTFHLDRLAAGDIDKMVPEALAEASFMRHASGDMLVADPRGRVSLGRGEQTGSVMAGFGLERVLSVPVRSDYAKGRLFIADKQDFAREELVLASLVALQIGVLLDRVQVIESAQQSAATDERLRLARDLHDGILQTLAGTALQLETIRRLAEQDPASLPARINEMQSWLLDEQREMRGFISKLRPPGPWVRSGLASEHADLPALVRALEQQWGATISLPAEVADVIDSAGMEFHARQILREAVANAVRHGGASDIGLRAELDNSALGLRIADNGKGLPVHGRFDERQCAQGRIGPRSLRERIVSLGGSMVIDSTPAGVTLSITLPLRNTNAADSDRSDRR
jgi:signal transduction histidine kinase